VCSVRRFVARESPERSYDVGPAATISLAHAQWILRPACQVCEQDADRLGAS